MKTSPFRKDINALRAIAVIAVVLFHFNPTWLPGGFAGVDVFFVISGFLMTSIIFRGFEQSNFNLFKFYVSRSNRIIPALAFLCAVLAISGWFYLSPNEYRALGKHIATSITFVSNYIYTNETGYFDSASHEKWLLHTWSLAVEWQFYIIYPIVLLILKRYLPIKYLKKIIIILFLLSLSYSIYRTYQNPTAAYYLLPTRAWEMLLGGIAFLYPIQLQNKHTKILEYLGLLLILSSCFLISNQTPWPGYMALIPVLGAYLIIIANNQNSLLSNNPILQPIGKWSYSIYLWHWPLVVLGVIYEITNWWMYGIALSLLFGFLSYQYIESLKFSSLSKWSDLVKLKPLWLSFSTALLGVLIFFSNGFQSHYDPRIIIVNNESKNKNPYNCMLNEEGIITPLSKCYIGNKDNIQAIIVGDSHADAITTAVTSIFALKQSGIIAITRTSCPFILNAKNNRADDTCYHENFLRLEEIKQNKKIPLILTARWSAYIYGQSDPKRIIKGDNRPSLYFGNNKYMSQNELLTEFSKNLESTLCALTPNAPVYITQPIPEMGQDIPKTMSRNLMQGKEIDLSIQHETYLQQNSAVRTIIQHAAQVCGATVLDPTKILCKDDKCIAQHQGRPIYYDGDHMSEYGNKLLSPMFKQVLN